MHSQDKPNGYVLHEDSERVTIATGFKRRSSNKKTGNMIQVWILPRNVKPSRAVKTGQDAVICGDCPLRGRKGKKRKCYVNVGQAPNGVWKAWKAGRYPQLPNYEKLFFGRKVRFGAYGDPIYIPHSIVSSIAICAAGWTGYTHQWHNPLFAAYRAFFMASVDSIDEMERAQASGWRTFRVSKRLNPDLSTERICLNTVYGISCADCGLCAGTSKQHRSIVIAAHGSGKVHFQEEAV